MKTRFNPFAVAPEAYKAVFALENYIQKDSGLPHSLIHLIKLRASILNGCAYCVDMHVKEARKDGLSEQWINLVSVWREARVYSDKERAVLAWTDALTLLSQTGAPDADFEPEGLAKLIEPALQDLSAAGVPEDERRALAELLGTSLLDEPNARPSLVALGEALKHIGLRLRPKPMVSIGFTPTARRKLTNLGFVGDAKIVDDLNADPRARIERRNVYEVR